ncbi:Tetraspanin-33 [Holothuria leucospilota]|uniref:Tetraspanin n=1 Tax=Holothuria leucospilota TaxID=206669 RepID=A0A9Q0YT91_HOLLE|nr:Tetraspanin-33 [Holothuria leucospilota]
MGKYHPSHHVNEGIRYVLYGFNFILWIVSVFLLLVGIFGIAIREDNLNINSHIEFLTDPAAILIAIAAVVFVVTFFGCVGALNENCLFLRIYFILLIIIFVIEIICGILTFAFSSQLQEKVDEVIQAGIKDYRTNADLTNFIDFAQRELECCGGLDGYKDWNGNRYFNCTDDNKSVERCAVPYSCCLNSDEEVINTMCGFQVQRELPVEASERIYITGCIDKFVQEARNRSLLLGIAVFGIAAFQLFGIFLAFELCRELEEERRNYHKHSATPS